MARALASVLLLVSVLLSARARADGPCAPRVVLHSSACTVDLVDPRAVVSALDVEVERTADVPTVSLVMEAVPCVPEATRVELSLVPEHGGRAVHRTIDLADLGRPERARVIALAASELARSTCSPDPPLPPSSTAPAALPSAKETPVMAPSDSASPQVVQPSPEPTHAARLSADGGGAFETAAFVSYSSALVGGRAWVGASLPSLPWLRGAVDGFVLRGSARDPLGEISLIAYGGAVSLLARGSGQSVRGEIGPRLDIGGTRATGTPNDKSVAGSTAAAILLIPSVTARVLLPLRGAASIALSVASGHTVTGQRAQADGRTAAGLAGPYLSIGIGLQSEL